MLREAHAGAGHAGLLLSNDEMRDHIFSLLAPKYFHKWKQRHQVQRMFLLLPWTQHLPTLCAQCAAQGGV